MIKTLSPYYITVPFVSPALGFTCAKYKLEVYVWNGLKNEAPEEPNYSITKNNPTASTGNDIINIARLINDFITFEPLDSVGTDLVDSENQVWVKTQIYYASTLTGDFETTAESIDTQLAVKGYGYGMSGENPSTPNNKILMPILEYSMPIDGKFVIPIELDETTPPTPSITITDLTLISDTSFTLEFTSVGTYDTFSLLAEAGGVGTLISGIGTTSPQVVTIPIPEEDFDAQMLGYDSLSNTNATSNTFNYIAP